MFLPVRIITRSQRVLNAGLATPIPAELYGIMWTVIIFLEQVLNLCSLGKGTALNGVKLLPATKNGEVL